MSSKILKPLLGRVKSMGGSHMDRVIFMVSIKISGIAVPIKIFDFKNIFLLWV
jgi:hypothetical protein